VSEELRDVDPRHIEVRRSCSELYKNGQERFETRWNVCHGGARMKKTFYQLPNGQNIFQKKKKEHLSEFFASQSPMQIGAAILSWSRHIANLVMFNIHEEDQIYTRHGLDLY